MPDWSGLRRKLRPEQVTGTMKDAAAPVVQPGGVRLRAFLDAEYYLERYPEARTSGKDPLTHFREVGHARGWCPHPALERIESALSKRAEVSDTPLADLIALLPRGFRRQALTDSFWNVLRDMVHPEFYAFQLRTNDVLTVDETIQNFLASGVFTGLRVSALFHSAWYAAAVEVATGEPIDDDTHPFFHWVTIGWKDRVVPTPLYDDEYYSRRNTDLVRWKEWAFAHYVRHGAYERRRRPSTFVAVAPTDRPNAKAAHRPHLLDQLLIDATPESAAASTPFEERTRVVVSKVRRLDSPVMREMVAKARAIEPLIDRPYGVRDVNWPPRLNSAVALMRQGEEARRLIGWDSVDNLVLVPHCRMAGSARVTGALARALAACAPDERTLVVTTDLDAFERPDWFPVDTRVVDLSALAEPLQEEARTRLLLDVVRGLQPRRVVNVNSRRGWELYQLFGKQLSNETELSAYLFTWDLDQHGNKGGYPISYFQTCLAHLSTVFLDSSALREELIWRYAFPKRVQDKLVLVHTPADYPDAMDHSGVFERRRTEQRRLRAFWAGRFDRQKRFDVVVELARQMPELEIWVWGKQVLGGSGVDFTKLPTNIRLQGTYQDFEDLPVESCDFFLYTSEWDGLPTILIDAGARGVATVASNVGGVGEVVNESTGYPVSGVLNVGDYRAAIEQMRADPAEVTRRSSRMREEVRSMCSEQAFVDAVRSALYRSHQSDTEFQAVVASDPTGGGEN